MGQVHHGSARKTALSLSVELQSQVGQNLLARDGSPSDLRLQTSSGCGERIPSYPRHFTTIMPRLGRDSTCAGCQDFPSKLWIVLITWLQSVPLPIASPVSTPSPASVRILKVLMSQVHIGVMAFRPGLCPPAPRGGGSPA